MARAIDRPGVGGHDVAHPPGSDDPDESHPIWRQDNVRLLSVGIDIGTASTQVALSRLHLQRSADGLTSRFVVVGRETAFESAVALTPYADDKTIDAEALGVILDEAYEAAGVSPADVDTGAVLITGEAMLRVNAERISDAVSKHAGNFVCAAAGHHMEAMLAAHGSGAVHLSHQRGATLLNIDIGGGTAKLSIVDNGTVVATGALDIGARHVVVADGKVVGLEHGGAVIAEGLGYSVRLGHPVAPGALEDIATWMADLILDVAIGTVDPALAARWWLTDPIGDVGSVEGVVFSGGVGEFVYGLETRDFGDLGHLLGRALRSRMCNASPLPLWEAAERIRATVLGAAGYTVQLSGLTTYNPAPGFPLPLRNLPVVRPRYDVTRCGDSDVVADAIRCHLSDFGLLAGDVDVAVALGWSGRSDYARLSGFAAGIRDGLEQRLSAGLPIIVIFDADIALSVGLLLREELGVTAPLLVLDGLDLRDFDFIDIGRPDAASKAVPVTIKSLVFRGGAASA
jgi:ethanolamine utilization protein EutA